MILQKIIMPERNDMKEQALFFRGDKAQLFSEMLQVDSGGWISFDTYYNLFSVDKWKHYTTLSDLYLNLEAEGTFTLEIFQMHLKGRRIAMEIADRFSVFAADRKSFRFPVRLEKLKGSCYFKLTCERSGKLYAMAWCTDQTAVRQIRFAIDMCTYKKRDFVCRNIAVFNKKIFKNKFSPLYGRVKLFLVDNEKSDAYMAYASEDIYVFSNKNTGGCGGFTRGMLEIMEKQGEYAASHVILMDDDVSVQISSLERTYTFLCFLKDEYQQSFIGGSILQLEKVYIQSGFGGRFKYTGGFDLHANADLRNLRSVLQNDCGKLPEYIPWCYCCIPVSCIQRELPMPVFLHHDDVEYAIRTASHCICLNGIGILHKPNGRKRPSSNAYYNVRNLLIVICLHKENIPRVLLKIYVTAKVWKNLVLARYKDAVLNIKGVEDFLRGPLWIANQNCEEKHREICENGYSYELFDEEKERKLKQEGYKIMRVGEEPVLKTCVYRKLCYINDEGKAFHTERNKQEYKIIIKQFLNILKRLDREYRKIQKEYQSKITDMITPDFWKCYLE